jgi:hypothetical protein
MRFAPKSDMSRLKAIGTLFIALTAVVILTKALGPFANEVAGSAFNRLTTEPKPTKLTEPKPTKPELAGNSRHYRLLAGPDGPTLVHEMNKPK